MATQQQIDSYLGPGEYAAWMQLEAQVKGEQNRYDNSRRLFLHVPLFSPLYNRIRRDFDLLIKIAGDYRQGMNLIAGGRKGPRLSSDRSTNSTRWHWSS